jgi:pyridoxine/pyridoxamine 5'-phosphate oxidase
VKAEKSLLEYPSIPKPIAELLNSEFASLPIAQVATVGEEGPVLRSMGMFALMDGAFPLFLTHCASHKWSQLGKNPQIALCFVNASKDKQILARGRALLHSEQSNRTLLEEYWQKVPSSVLSIYAQANVEGSYQDQILPPVGVKVPSNFGVIQVVPLFWEQLVFDPQNYANSVRIQHRYISNGWSTCRVQVC